MDYQKIIPFLDKIKLLNDLNLKQKIGLKQMMMHVESITPIVKLNLSVKS